MVPFQFNEDTVEDFRKGMCFLLSFFLHQKKGWKMKGVCEERFILHAVSCPHSGGLVDVKGYFEDNQDLLQDLSYPDRVYIRDIEKWEMKEYIEDYEREEKKYGRVVAKRVSNWHQKKIKV